MDDELHILMLEDSAADAELAELELCRAGLEFSTIRVEAEHEFRAAIDAFSPDIILADYNLPAFNGMEALKMARELCPRVPYIFVSGAIGEDRAIEALRLGATDYVLKDRLSRLVPVVQRVLHEVEEHAELERSEEVSYLRMEDLALINSLNENSNRGEDIQQIVDFLARETGKIFSGNEASVYLLNEDETCLVLQRNSLPRSYSRKIARLISSHAGPDGCDGGLRIYLDPDSIYLKILRDSDAKIIKDSVRIQSMMREFTRSRALQKVVPQIHAKLGINEVICVPLVSHGKAIGLLDMSTSGSYSEQDLQRIKIISDQLTVILKRRQAEEELQQSLEKLRNIVEEIVWAVALVVEMRDPYTAGHQRRVADLARAVAEEMGLAQDQIEGIRVAATLHDLGKVHIPAEILGKPGKLNELEMSYIRTHPRAGYEILKTIEFPWPISRIVLQHHERMDGSGYPEGLFGDRIILEARIITVADVIEAMASHRPYRPALGIDIALREMSRKKGTLFDSDAVDACLRLFHEKGYMFDEDEFRD